MQIISGNTVNVYAVVFMFSGRPWKLDELRLKSNTDLHKLWYVKVNIVHSVNTMYLVYLPDLIPIK